MPVSAPMRRIGSLCCARAASGQAAVPPRSVMNSRRFTALRPPALPAERIAHLSYGMRLLHWDFDPPHDCSGSFSTELVWTKRSLRSAMPPIAIRTFAPQRFDALCQKRSHASQQATPSIDYLIGPQEELLGNCQAERFGGGQVDDELELGRLLDRKVGGLRPLEKFCPPGRLRAGIGQWCWPRRT